MATHAPVSTPRQPFAVLGSPRLQHLTSMKNRQNGVTASPLTNGKSPLSTMTASSPVKSSTKRQLPVSIYDENDSENMDPCVFSSPTKRSKCSDSTPVKPKFVLSTSPSFNFSKQIPDSTNGLGATTPSAKVNTSSPRVPLTAPAGRSPKSKRAGGLLDRKLRRVSAPYTRVDPPSFSSSSNNTSSTLPFSLDAALSGTLSRSSKQSKATTIEETMPRDWFFDIHEDTPEEEASNMMEHSALFLDISSDEESKRREADDRGKENVAPVDYEAPVTRSAATAAAASGSAAPRDKATKKALLRRKIVKMDEMDDGERSPLSDLETEPFFSEGLDKDSVVVVGGGDKTADQTAFLEVKSTVEEKQDVTDVPFVSKQAEIDGEILIFEDMENAPPVEISSSSPLAGGKRKRVEVSGDENAF